MLMIKLAAIAVLAIIAWQDFSSRLVSIILFPLLVALLVFEKNIAFEHWGWSSDVLMDLAFLTVQLLILTAYFSLKNGRFVWVFVDMLGSGDLLLLGACCFYFSPLNYIFFYLASLFFSLFCWSAYRYLFKPDAVRVPLAGLQSLVFIFFLLCAWFHNGHLFSSDEWILRFMKWS